MIASAAVTFFRDAAGRFASNGLMILTALTVWSTVDSIFMIGRSVQINAVMIQKASKTPRMALIVARTL